MIFLNALKKIESAFYTVIEKVERPKVYKVMRVYDTPIIKYLRFTQLNTYVIVLEMNRHSLKYI
jgi:hypothetical protein